MEGLSHLFVPKSIRGNRIGCPFVFILFILFCGFSAHATSVPRQRPASNRTSAASTSR
jgi:hypothetical protein